MLFNVQLHIFESMNGDVTRLLSLGKLRVRILQVPPRLGETPVIDERGRS